MISTLVAAVAAMATQLPGVPEPGLPPPSDIGSTVDAVHAWHAYLDAPPDYAAFARKVEKTGSYELGDILVEEYRQANGPDTYQRLMMALPKSAAGKLPAVVVPFYYPEAMLGFNPKTGGVDFFIE